MAKCPRCNEEVTYWTLWNGEYVAHFFTTMGSDQYIKCDKCKSECLITTSAQADFAMFMAAAVACLMVAVIYIISISSENVWEFYHSIAIFLIFGAQFIFWRYFIVLEPSDKDRKEK